MQETGCKIDHAVKREVVVSGKMWGRVKGVQGFMQRRTDMLFFLTPSRSFWSKNRTFLKSKIITICQTTSLITLRSQWKKCLNYLHKRMIRLLEGKKQAMSHEKRNTSGYITEQWATDTHCKHQSGMEKHLTHDSNPHPTLTATPMKGGQWIGLSSKS